MTDWAAGGPQLEAGLAKCGALAPGIDVGPGIHGCSGLVNGTPHLFKFVETYDGTNNATAYNCYQQGAANVGSYYTIWVQRAGASSTTWTSSFDNGLAPRN